MKKQIEVLTTQEELAAVFGVSVETVKKWHTQGMPYIQYQKESGGAFYPCYFVPAVTHWLSVNDWRGAMPDLSAFLIADSAPAATE